MLGIMETELNEKINLIKSLNTDNSRFIIKVLDTLSKYNMQIEQKKKNINISTNTKDIQSKEQINLDKIWSKPYFYTKMRLKFNMIYEKIDNTDIEYISNNLKYFCKKLINIKVLKNYKKPEDSIDIVQFIQTLRKSENLDFEYYASNIDEETIFKKEQIEKAIQIIKIKDKKEQISKIYDEVCNYLNEDFISNKYCDFINDRCVAQRHHQFYPVNKKDGCCFMQIRKCTHLDNGKCTVKCLACKLFSCPYLSKMGVEYYASEIVLLKAFFDKKQRKYLVYSFYKTKEEILKELAKQ